MRAFVFPGQGSQRRGMGEGLFERFPEQCSVADDILGYSIRELCLEDPEERLRSTLHAQPALFVVNCLAYLDRIRATGPPDFLAGHSLGELCALFAAGCFDFARGARLVKARAELMNETTGGAMVAVMGLELDRLAELIRESGILDVDVANINTPNQVVLSGPSAALTLLSGRLSAAGSAQRPVRCVPLAVSAAFHSRSMAAAAASFEELVRRTPLAAPRLPVIANVTGRPYEARQIARLLGEQIRSPVRWWDCMRTLREQGVEEVEEIGPGRVLTGLWRSAFAAASPPPKPKPEPKPEPKSAGRISAESLGSAEFRRDYRLRFAYLAGSMYQGIASTEMVTRLGKAGLMGFLGAGGLGLETLEAALHTLRRDLGQEASWGVNLLYSLDDSELEAATVALLLHHDVRFVEAAAYLRMTAPLVGFRFKGAHFTAAGEPVAPRRVVAKVSRPEIATLFLAPPGDQILATLVESGRLTRGEAEVARRLPVAADLCVEADSGGHTDAGRPYTLMPAMLRLREQAMARHGYPTCPRIGAAGGIGSPEAVAAAFILGADFVLTGSINQCSPEAGTSEPVKELLAQLDVQDTTYTVAGDMFELGAKVQVASRGTLFAARANKLHQIYRRYDSLEEIDEPTRKVLEERTFKRSIAEVWRQTEEYLAGSKPRELEKARTNPKHRMALVFAWYFVHSTRLALEGAPDRVNYQVHCGPAMGAFNRTVRGTALEDWRNRHVDVIAEHLMRGAAALLEQRFRDLVG